MEPDDPYSDHRARERWNRRYTERGVAVFPEAPAEWLIENRAVLSGSGDRGALDVACGDGRNAVYLARRRPRAVASLVARRPTATGPEAFPRKRPLR